MRQRVGILIVVGLAALAGCNTFVGPSTPTETVTPAPVPAAATPTAEPDGPLPPGLRGGGVNDVDALANAHEDTLRGASYTWHVRTGFGENVSEQQLAVESPRRYTYTDSGSGPQIDTSEFADGAIVYSRFYRFIEQVRRVPAPNATDAYGQKATRAIEQYLAVENASVGETLVGGSLHYRVRAQRDRYEQIDGARNYTVTAVIAPDGFVRALNATYVLSDGDRRVPVEYGYRYERVGTTTVEPPAWFTDDEWATNPTQTPD